MMRSLFCLLAEQVFGLGRFFCDFRRRRLPSLPKMRISSMQRRHHLAFLLYAIKELRSKPQIMTKYCAVTFFHERYLPYLERQLQSFPCEADIQLNCLLCLWIASKLHETPPISIRKLQNLANKLIPDHYYTRKDLINAELKFLEAINFTLQTGPLISTYIEELLIKFSENSKTVAELVTLKLCLGVLDLVYVCNDEILKDIPIALAGASILASAYVLAVPTNKCDFPMLTWLQLATNAGIANLKECTRKILECVLAGVNSAETGGAGLEHMS